MPFVHVRIHGEPLSADQSGRVAAEMTRLMAEVMGKKKELTAVFVEPAAGTWTVGGAPAPRAAHVEAAVTEGTNSEAEKAGFIAAAAAMLRDVLGAALPIATYVIVRQLPADAWGYDGRTQADRRARG
ncbi:4-oxalocrotonate tautomerase [Amorphus suaedae]